MTSNNRLNMFHENVKIKIEPGIKVEPGTSQRLSSLKLPRDLKLGGSKAKIIKPNLNVVRNKKGDVSSPALQNIRGRGRGRGRGGDRGRGAPRGRTANTVQSYGVFSDGIAESLMRRAAAHSDRHREDKDFDCTKLIDKPTINKNIELKIDKEQEDVIMNDLLSVDIEPDDPYGKNEHHPVQLPVMKCDQLKSIIKIETLIKQEDKPMENGSSDKKLFEMQDKLLFFQFPDSLPGIGPRTEPENSTPNSTSKEKEAETENPQHDNKCSLQDVSEGLLGKIVIYKSGKSKLLIGNNRFDLQMGPNAGFLQDVMSVPLNTETKHGAMINLGSLEGNVIVTPEWNTLLRLTE